MPYSAGSSQFKLSYEINPIVLTGGIASGIPGGALTVLSLLQALSFGALTGTSDVGLDDTFANFYPLAGGTLIENQVGNYPFANMTVAANAMIAQPLAISLMMRIPVRDSGGYDTKTTVMTSLQNAIKQHCQAGGTFGVATPTFYYDNTLLIKLHDVSGGEILQAQYQYQWDFLKPLVTLDDAAAVQSASMALLSSGGATDGALSGITPTIGQGVTTATPVISPASAGSIGAGSGTGTFGLGGDGAS